MAYAKSTTLVPRTAVLAPVGHFEMLHASSLRNATLRRCATVAVSVRRLTFFRTGQDELRNLPVGPPVGCNGADEAEGDFVQGDGHWGSPDAFFSVFIKSVHARRYFSRRSRSAGVTFPRHRMSRFFNVGGLNATGDEGGVNSGKETYSLETGALMLFSIPVWWH